MNKNTIILLGLVTLLVFPAISLAVLWFFSSKNPIDLLELNSFHLDYISYGIFFGVAYAFLSLWLFNRPYFESEMNQHKRLISQLNLTLLDKTFLSFCAGFGEEILFRVGMQHYLGVWITSIFFIAIHGYLNPKKLRLAIYGLLLIPFILILGFSYAKFGLWSIIAAHFSYDLVLFLFIKKENSSLHFEENFRLEENFSACDEEG